MPRRSNYQQIYDEGGAEALMEAIRAECPNPESYDRELLRMEKMGVWEIAWDVDDGTPVIVGRRPGTGRFRVVNKPL